MTSAAVAMGACTTILGDFNDGTTSPGDAGGGGMDVTSPEAGPPGDAGHDASDATTADVVEGGPPGPPACAAQDGGCVPTALCSYSNETPVNTTNDDQLVLVDGAAYWTPSLDPADGAPPSVAGVLSCATTPPAPGATPDASVVFSPVSESSGSNFNHSYADWDPIGVITADSTLAYWLVEYSHGGAGVTFLPTQLINWSGSGGISPDGGAPFEPGIDVTLGFGDPSSTQGLYFYTPSGATLVRGGIGSVATTCVDRTDAGTVDDGVAASNTVLIADDSNGVFMTTQVSSAGCSAPTIIATGTSREDSVALSRDGKVFATEINGDIYICSTATGCSSALPATALISSLAASTGEGTVGGNGNTYGIAFDNGTLAGDELNVYWIGSAVTGGLVRCAVKMTNGVGSCSNRTVLVPTSAALQPSSGIAVDSTSVYYLQGGTLFSVPK